MRPPYLLFVLAAAIPAPAASAQGPPEEAALVTLLGNDTVAVERTYHYPDRVRAEVVLRVPKTTLSVYDVRFDATGRPVTMQQLTYDPASGLDGQPVERMELTLDQGSGIPFIDMMHWPFELMLRRAVAVSRDTLTLDLVAGRRTLPFLMRRVGRGRYTAAHPTRGIMDIETDEEGRLRSLDASKTTRALRVMRREAADISALARSFAARDAQGRAMGELSGRGKAEALLAGASITVDYGRPMKRGREIFGALVPWGKVWRTGANQATHFSTTRDLRVGDAVLPAGTYTLFTIPGPDRWTLLVNRRTNINGQAYDAAHDLLRLEMPIRGLPEVVELFTIVLDAQGGGGVLRLRWDRTEAYLPFQVAN
ncbi:MAG: DUF2911 domain-containing protein [Gemmatimonadetes bacterium]|nr:DUF2911 domain-containing protein [Gemmatimonadota bacterium]